MQTPTPEYINKRAVRILLECILVSKIFSKNCMKMKEIGLGMGASLAPLGSADAAVNQHLHYLGGRTIRPLALNIEKKLLHLFVNKYLCIVI